MNARIPSRALLLATLAALTACSPRRAAINVLATAISGDTSVYGSDEDPELVRDAIPFGLKTMESLLEETPEHKRLLLAACRGFTQYSYAFVQQDAEVLAEKELAAARQAQDRARKLFLRGRAYCLRALEVAHPGFGDLFKADPDAALKKLTAGEVALLYWTGASWGSAISVSKGQVDLVGDLPLVGALMRRALELDETFDRGAIHEFFISYEGGRPAAMGGSVERARRHFERALELSKGTKASPYVSWAETVSVSAQNRAEFDTLIAKALAVDPAVAPEYRLANLVAQRRARRLKAREDDLFFQEAP